MSTSYSRSVSAGTSSASARGSRSGSEGLNGPRLMRIDVTSDIICPYSLIGIRQLLLAIEIYNHHRPHAPIHPLIRMLPYQLNPQHTSTPIQRRLHRTMKFGSVEAGENVRLRSEEKLRKVGIEPCSEGLISSSHVAHRLQTLSLLRHPSHHLELALDLLIGYHTTSVHPSDKEFLSAIAVKHSLFSSTREAMNWLDGDEFDYEVTRAYGVARRLGVTGVPFFVFGGRWAASGAVGVDDFVKLLHDIVYRETAGSATPSPTSTLDMQEPQKVYNSTHDMDMIDGRVNVRQRVSAEREIKAESLQPPTPHHEAELLNFLARGDEGKYNHHDHHGQAVSPPALPGQHVLRSSRGMEEENLRLPRILAISGPVGVPMGGNGAGGGFSSVRGTGILG